MADRWVGFERAMQRFPWSASDFWEILHGLPDEAEPGPDTQELAACAYAMLALLGEVSLGVAQAPVEAAEAAGRSAWPNLYLARAAVAHHDPELALAALRRLDTRYFDSQDLHWRTVEAIELTAWALCELGDTDSLLNLIYTLNSEFLNDVELESPVPVELVDSLLSRPVEQHLLRLLLDGLDIATWVARRQVGAVEAAIASEGPRAG